MFLHSMKQRMLKVFIGEAEEEEEEEEESSGKWVSDTWQLSKG